MPKQPLIEYFMLRAPTPKEMLGDAVAALTKLGLNEVHFDLMTDVPAFAKNNRQAHDTTATEFLAEWIKEHPTFHAKEVTAAMKADGRTSAAGYYATKMLLEKLIIKKLDDNGNYTRADVKQIAAPSKRDTFAVNHRDFILGYARQHNGRFSLPKIRAYFKAHKRKESSVGGAVNHLVEQKLIKGLGEGEYVLLSKSKAPAKKKPPAKKAPALNGAAPAAVTTTETANG